MRARSHPTARATNQHSHPRLLLPGPLSRQEEPTWSLAPSDASQTHPANLTAPAGLGQGQVLGLAKGGARGWPRQGRGWSRTCFVCRHVLFVGALPKQGALATQRQLLVMIHPHLCRILRLQGNAASRGPPPEPCARCALESFGEESCAHYARCLLLHLLHLLSRRLQPPLQKEATKQKMRSLGQAAHPTKSAPSCVTRLSSR
jgi:hypothetical protein